VLPGNGSLARKTVVERRRQRLNSPNPALDPSDGIPVPAPMVFALERGLGRGDQPRSRQGFGVLDGQAFRNLTPIAVESSFPPHSQEAVDWPSYWRNPHSKSYLSDRRGSVFQSRSLNQIYFSQSAGRDLRQLSRRTSPELLHAFAQTVGAQVRPLIHQCGGLAWTGLGRALFLRWRSFQHLPTQ